MPMMTMPAFTVFRLRSFARDTRGVASIELAIGAVVLVAISALAFDLYARVRADTAGVRMAATMADYVSRDAVPDGNELRALGEFLHEQELRVSADLVYVLSALRQPAGDPPPAVEVLWSDDSIRFGDETATEALAGNCARHVGEGATAVLPETFRSGMAPGEVVVIAEVCARLRREGAITGRFVAGDIYRFHAAPAREPDEPPAAPDFASLNGGNLIAQRHGGASVPAERPPGRNRSPPERVRRREDTAVMDPRPCSPRAGVETAAALGRRGNARSNIDNTSERGPASIPCGSRRHPVTPFKAGKTLSGPVDRSAFDGGSPCAASRVGSSFPSRRRHLHASARPGSPAPFSFTTP